MLSRTLPLGLACALAFDVCVLLETHSIFPCFLEPCAILSSWDSSRQTKVMDLSDVVTANDVEDEIRLAGGGEVSSSRGGLAVLERLRTLDEVAYLRFASVYKNFAAASDFQSELELLSKPSRA